MIDTDCAIESSQHFGVIKRKAKMLFSCFRTEDRAVTRTCRQKTKVTMETRKEVERRKKRKVVVVGDGECGKTCLLQRFCHDTYNTHGYLPTVFETEVVEVQVDKTTVDLTLIDTAGQEDYDRLRPFFYPDTDVVIICFALDNADSLENVRLNWEPEIRYFCGSSVPILLVGNKLDVRVQDDLDEGAQDGSTSSDSEDSCHRPSARLIKQGPVKASYARKVAKELDAVGYWETSALLDQGVTEVFRAAAKEALVPRSGKKIKKSKKKTWKRRSGRRGVLERLGLKRR